MDPNVGGSPEGEGDTAVPAAWHALPLPDVLARVASQPGGLAAAEASRRLEVHGPNALPAPPRRAGWKRFLAQFNNVLIVLLLVSGLAAAALGHVVDAVLIFAVVLVNAVLGHVQEGKAERAMEAIGRMLLPRARARRDGEWQAIEARLLVPGDVVALKAGDQVPADLRLLDSHGLRIDQAALTGESVPVSKRVEEGGGDVPLAERSGMAHAGTMVAAGQGAGVVIATGRDTELGRISRLLEGVQELRTPLLRQIARFGTGLSLVTLVLAAVMVLAMWLVHRTPAADGFLAGVALVVAAVPEGLPAIITITLAVGVRRMASRNAIVRRLPAVETLGTVSVICTDKTGTLTRNELVAEQASLATGRLPAGHLDVGDPSALRLLEAAVLCNDAPPGGREGDPLERALVAMAESAAMDVAGVRARDPRSGLLPFSSNSKFMATRHGSRAFLKGAPEAMLARCDSEAGAEGVQSLDADRWQGEIDALAASGFRVLAFAAKSMEGADDGFSAEDVDGGACLLGLVAFADPPRAEVPAAIRACASAGIMVKMITGDHAATATAIADELEIAGAGGVLTGVQIDRLDDAALAARVESVHVFARTTPEHKLRLVDALQAQGRVVAMTGDGANDAPALKKADIGVAMGIKGTEASRQAAGIVLTDDNFATIVSGVEEGRGVYDNIRKTLLFILPTNAAEVLVILIAAVLGMSLPLTPVQILWVNMATAITLALPLAVEPRERNVMARRPRAPGRGLITGFVAMRILWVGALITAGVFVLFHWVMASTGDLGLARSVALNALVAAEMVYLFNARRWLAPGWTREAVTANPWAWLSVAALVVMQGVVTYWGPAQAVFGTRGLAIAEWMAVAAMAVAVFVAVELEKALLRARADRRRRRAACTTDAPVAGPAQA